MAEPYLRLRFETWSDRHEPGPARGLRARLVRTELGRRELGGPGIREVVAALNKDFWWTNAVIATAWFFVACRARAARWEPGVACRPQDLQFDGPRPSPALTIFEAMDKWAA